MFTDHKQSMSIQEWMLTPWNDANKHGILIVESNERTTAVSLACIFSAFVKAGAHHACRDSTEAFVGFVAFLLVDNWNFSTAEPSTWFRRGLRIPPTCHQAGGVVVHSIFGFWQCNRLSISIEFNALFELKQRIIVVNRFSVVLFVLNDAFHFMKDATAFIFTAAKANGDSPCTRNSHCTMRSGQDPFLRKNWTSAKMSSVRLKRHLPRNLRNVNYKSVKWRMDRFEKELKWTKNQKINQ